MPILRSTLLFFLLLPILSYAQDKLINNIEISGAYIFDEDDYYDSQSDNYHSLYASKNNYSGFNHFLFSLGGENEIGVYAFELEFSAFRLTPPTKIIDHGGVYEIIPKLERLKLSSQINVYYGKKIIKTEKYQFIAAPLISFRFHYEELRPTAFPGFPMNKQALTFGLGVKLKNQIWITKRFGISVGSRFILLDMGIERERLSNPALPLRLQTEGIESSFDLIRNELLLQMGLQLKI